MSTKLPGSLNSKIKSFLSKVVAWAESDLNLCAIALVGSYARGDATPSSDIDLVILAKDPDRYLQDRSWISLFGEPDRIEEEDWGKVASLRAFLPDGLEIEFGITGYEWASEPLDKGDAQVIRDGIIVLYDTDRFLTERISQFGVYRAPDS